MSQNAEILSHLKRGPISPMQALSNFGCMRLAARIEELRGKGHNIHTEMVERSGKRFAEYYLMK